MGSGNNTNHGAYDLGELDQALFLYLDGQQADTSTTSNHLHQDQRRKTFLFNFFFQLIIIIFLILLLHDH